MATSNSKKSAFAGLGTNFITESQAPAAASPGDGKPYAVNFHLDPEHIRAFERNLFWLGRSATRKTLLNEALAYYFANHPGAIERGQQPTPDESRR